MLTIKNENKARHVVRLACAYSVGDPLGKLARSAGENMVSYRNELGQYCEGYVLGIDREDGSGKCFNVKVGTINGHTRTIFHRCQ